MSNISYSLFCKKKYYVNYQNINITLKKSPQSKVCGIRAMRNQKNNEVPQYCELNEQEILEYGTFEEVNALIEAQTDLREKTKLKQMKMTRFCNIKHLTRYIAGRRLMREAEEFFFKHAPVPVLVNYIKRYNIPNGQNILLQRCSKGEIISYLSKYRLCEESEKLLLKRGVHAEIKAYIKKHYFNDEQEMHFIKRGKHREIMLYLAKHSLCDIAQKELIYRRNNEEIMYFIRQYPLADCAVEALYRCGTDRTLEFWLVNGL